MTSSKISWSRSRNQYLVLKLCKLEKPSEQINTSPVANHKHLLYPTTDLSVRRGQPALPSTDCVVQCGSGLRVFPNVARKLMNTCEELIKQVLAKVK